MGRGWGQRRGQIVWQECEALGLGVSLKKMLPHVFFMSFPLLFIFILMPEQFPPPPPPSMPLLLDTLEVVSAIVVVVAVCRLADALFHH